MALRTLIKTEINKPTVKKSVEQLYKACLKEVPRVLAIYDFDIPYDVAKASIKYHFKKNAHVKDSRIISILLAKGYTELEETLLQWKQRPHLARLLNPEGLIPKREATPYEKVILALKEDDRSHLPIQGSQPFY
mmetsp:Transcript_20390/g.18529  ORF Transcript_20390/g.18529 Transcript_20390/m.18529 type:complete len:134 (+) Transcript_20390:50-451(+)